MTYTEKLKDPRWQRKRLEIMQRDDFMCQNCGDNESTLNVDHKVYRKGADPWDYDDGDLWTLCEDCHDEITEIRRRLNDAIGRMNSYELGVAEKLLTEIPIEDEVLIMEAGQTRIYSLKEWHKFVDFAVGALRKEKKEEFGNALD